VSLSSTGIGLALLRAFNAGLGLLLSIGLAVVFGVSRDTDALFVAMAVGVFLGRDLARVVGTAAVPCLVEHDEGRGPSDFPAMFQTTALILAVGSVALVWGAAPWIVGLTSPGFDAETARKAQRLLRLLAPSLLLFVLSGSAQAVFHAHRRFFAPEIGETVWRVLAIAALFSLGRHWGVDAYATGLTFAAFLQWSVLFVAAARNGFQVLPLRWTPIRMRLLKPFWLCAIVVLCTVVQMQIEGILDRAVISFMKPGSIALHAYANRLALMLPLLLSTSLLTPWLPEIARLRTFASDMRQWAKRGALFMAGLGALLAIIVVWAARDAAEFILLRGRFDASSTEVVIMAGRAFALGIPAIFCVQCLAGLYVVDRDLRSMIRMSLVAVLAHAAGNLALRRWGVPGIALSGSLTIWIVAFYLWRRIQSREPVSFPWSRFFAALAVSTAMLYLIPWPLVLPWAPVRVVAGAIFAYVAYTAVMWPAIRRMQAHEREATRPDATRRPERPHQDLPDP
jgi:putative peptidoglycan lipid II flippase